MNAFTGSARAITRLTLRLVPLTPVHIGDGTELRPDAYFIEEPKAAFRSDTAAAPPAVPATAILCRFDQSAAMRTMTASQRTAFASALDGGKLGDAAQVLRQAGQRHVVDRIAIAGASAFELRKAMNDPLARTGEVRPFVRSGGRPYIPGSSIKGAFRTALASHRLPRKVRPADGWTHEHAMREAFGLDPNDTATDPLRFLHVADAFLPEGATLIDKAEVVKRGGEPIAGGKGGIQMHYERTRARSDAQHDRTSFDVALMLGRGLGVDRVELFRITSRFHWIIWEKERELFFRHCFETVNAMDRLLKQIRLPSGGSAAERGLETATNYVLLRLGRFGHFESKSLDGMRRGHFPQARNPVDRVRQPNEWGSTRTVTRDANNNSIPFGWVIGWVVKEDRA